MPLHLRRDRYTTAMAERDSHTLGQLVAFIDGTIQNVQGSPEFSRHFAFQFRSRYLEVGADPQWVSNTLQKANHTHTSPENQSIDLVKQLLIDTMDDPTTETGLMTVTTLYGGNKAKQTVFTLPDNSAIVIRQYPPNTLSEGFSEIYVGKMANSVAYQIH